MTSRRNFLKGVGVTIAGLGIDAKVTLPDGRQGEIASVNGGTAKVLLYWYCPECGRMNTQRAVECVMCKAPFSEQQTIKVDLTKGGTSNV